MDIVILTFFIMIVIGHGLFIAGCVLSYYPLMIIGRFIFGAGCESYAMAISPLLIEYFRGKELSFALGLTLALSRIGSSINDVTTLIFFQMTNSIIFAISVGFVLVLFCLSLILILLCYRMRHIKQQSNGQRQEPLLRNDTINKTKPHHEVDFDQSITANYYAADSLHSIPSIGGQSIQKMPSIPPIAISDNNPGEATPSHHILSANSRTNPLLDASPHLFGVDYSTSNLMENTPETIDISDDINQDGEGAQFKWSDIKQFDVVYWLLLVNCGLIYGCITPWMNVGADFLQKTFGYGHSRSNQLLMVPYICGGIFTPTLGYISDKIGKRTQLLFLSTLCLIGAHYILGWSHTTSIELVIVALALLGMAFALFCAVIWPSFALVVEERYLGTGYGIPTSFYNLMVTIDYLVVGAVTRDGDGEDKYLMVEYFLMGMSMLSILTVGMLLIADRRTGKRLDKPSMEAAERRKLSL